MQEQAKSKFSGRNTILAIFLIVLLAHILFIGVPYLMGLIGLRGKPSGNAPDRGSIAVDIPGTGQSVSSSSAKVSDDKKQSDKTTLKSSDTAESTKDKAETSTPKYLTSKQITISDKVVKIPPSGEAATSTDSKGEKAGKIEKSEKTAESSSGDKWEKLGDTVPAKGADGGKTSGAESKTGGEGGKENPYYGKVTSYIKSNWEQPSKFVIGDKKPVTLVAVSIDEKGNLLSWSISERSGVPAMDSSVENFFSKLKTLPTPPPEIRTFTIYMDMNEAK